MASSIISGSIDASEVACPRTPQRFESHALESPLSSSLVERWISWLNSIRSWQAALILVTYFLIVFCFDFVTGDELVLILLYLPVIAFVTVRLSLKVSIVLSFACSIGWLADDVWLMATDPPTSGEVFCATIHFICFTVTATIISRLNEALRHEFASARTDALTGLWNMKAFNAEVSHRLNSVQHAGQPYAMVFIDLDNFKSVNDTRGHEAGDLVLKVISNILRTQLRGTDCIARYGGDEFIAMLPAIDESSAVALISRLRTNCLQAMEKRGWPVTLSIGIACFDDPTMSVDQAIRAADNLMYEGKHARKDSIVTRHIQPSGLPCTK